MFDDRLIDKMSAVANAECVDEDTPERGKGLDPTQDPTQHAAELAREHVPECIDTLLSVMRAPTRQSPPQVAAAKLLLEIAGQLKPEPETKQKSPKLQLVDAQTAAQVIRERLAQRG